MKIATKSKRRWWEKKEKKTWWNFVHYEQSYKRSCWQTLRRQCAFGVCQCIWVRATWLWCRGNFTFLPNFFSVGLKAPGKLTLGFASNFWFFFPREICETRGPSGVKFCKMVSTIPSFIMPVQNFSGHTPKRFQGPKHANFGSISVDFKVRRRISLKQIKIFKIGELHLRQRFLPR